MIDRTEADIMKNWGGKVYPVVTIRCITYNQEEVIGRALDSFLMQKTNFPFEILVHDDASTDKTADVIREYQNKYPTIIRPIYETENQYSKHDGSLRRIMNENTRGKYVSACEGDDYMCDEHKLQIQYEVMENNPQCSMCVHNTAINYIDDKAGDKYFCDWTNEKRLTERDVFFNWKIHASSYFYKSEFTSFPFKSDTEAIGDYVNITWFFFKGEIIYLPYVMSVYNAGNPKGITASNRSNGAEYLINRKIQRKNYLLEYNEITNHKFNDSVTERIQEIEFDILNYKFDCVLSEKDNGRKAVQAAAKACYTHPFYKVYLKRYGFKTRMQIRSRYEGPKSYYLWLAARNILRKVKGIR